MAIRFVHQRTPVQKEKKRKAVVCLPLSISSVLEV
jgi:hypothetical protein